MIQKAKNTLRVGEVLNEKWVILEFIAKGGMGEVYRAHQLNLKRDVAIKIISREWLDSLEDNEEGLQSGLQRFRNEVAAMAQVRHPNVLQIFDYGSITIGGEDAPITHEYIAMEFIPGSTLRSTMSEEGFFPEEDLIREWLMDYFLPVLDGVETLHAAEIIHRDLKPENILLDGSRPKIADFGLARSKNVGRVSHSADMFGTPAYMPPEQFLDFRRTDRRSDIYALGKILYETLAGRITAKNLPFKSAGLESAQTPFLRCLDKIIRRSTSEDKDERPKSIKDFRESLVGAVDISLGKATHCKTSVSATVGGFSSGKASQKKWFWIPAVLILSALLVYLLAFRNRNDSHESATGPVVGPTAFKEASKSGSSPPWKSRPSAVSSIPGRVFDSGDGVAMHLIPGGTFTLPENWGPGLGGKVRVASFYLDETQVTNLQYVEFLNQQISRLTVETGVVRADGSIWLMLGEVLDGYEPILFKEGRFHVKNPVHAACPVVRVTAHGAAAYAR
ncbi:MAG TPA: bifunctional serine/threonine-protein kinase/formylglycine-generating enzyme family protein, partial [Desulfobacteria bacterium]|nr:bifunctional serine/threonine-protein kinase/formylglycine-generating enzyme family protein [Desulfobacteria bacterium]